MGRPLLQSTAPTLPSPTWTGSGRGTWTGSGHMAQPGSPTPPLHGWIPARHGRQGCQCRCSCRLRISARKHGTLHHWPDISTLNCGRSNSRWSNNALHLCNLYSRNLRLASRENSRRSNSRRPRRRWQRPETASTSRTLRCIAKYARYGSMAPVNGKIIK